MKIDGASSYITTQQLQSTPTQAQAQTVQPSSPQTLESDTVQLSSKGQALQQGNDVVVINSGDSGGELPPRDDN